MASAVALVLAAGVGCREKQPTPAAVPGRPPASTPAETSAQTQAIGAPHPAPPADTAPGAAGMASLQPGDAVMTVNGVTLSWGEVQRAVRWPAGSEQPSGDMVKKVRNVVSRFVQRSLLLAEAKRRGLVVTEDEKKAFLEELGRGLAASGRSTEDYLKQFPEKPTSPLQTSLEDTLLVVKLGKELVEKSTVTDTEIKQASAQMTLMRNAVIQANDKSRAEGKRLAELPEAQTDLGFAALAKEYSDGTEAPTGGVVGTFTQAEIEAVNGPLPFTPAAGKTSPLIETETALRIIRILEQVPPETEGGAERFRIAQILLPKTRVPEPPERERVADNIKQQKSQALLQQHALELAKEAKISCPLFPDLLQ